MTEAVIQKKIIKKLQAQGWLDVKLIQTNKNGLPDLMFLKDGQIFFIEVKRKGGVPAPLQKYRIKQLTDLGFTVLTVDDVDDAKVPFGEIIP